MFSVIRYLLQCVYPKTKIKSISTEPQINRDLQLKISQLPIELRNKIITYTYSPQPQSLCSDIRDYSQSFRTIFTIYKLLFHNDNDTYNWISNNIIVYFNESLPTMFGIVLKFKNIIHRNPFIKTHKQETFFYLYSSPKILWGLLTPKERDKFINYGIHND